VSQTGPKVPDFEFFRRRGLYCQRGFLDRSDIDVLVRLASEGLPHPVKVFDELPQAEIDFEKRSAWTVSLDEAHGQVNDRFDALQPHLERHFGQVLRGHEGPALLMYPPGGFYESHVDSDAAATSHPDVRSRRISVVAFINSNYSGGALTFYGLVDDAAWRQYGFALDPEPGTLVAFPSDLRHEVTPVTAGHRYTLVDWFTA
jgi:predicted 2-oxoglutarate/Fe(II)-dependent dioxygenase YbiX